MKKEYVFESGSENESGQPPDAIIDLAVMMTTRLKGKTISVVRYTTEKEEKQLGFKHKAPLILFEDDTIMIPCFSRTTKAGSILLEAGEFVTNVEGIESIPSL